MDRHILQVHVGSLSPQYEALSIEVGKQTTSIEIVACIVERLGLSAPENYELAEVIGNAKGQDCKERRLGTNESPFGLQLLWPNTADQHESGQREYRFCLREKSVSDSIWAEPSTLDSQLIKDYFYKFLYQPKDKEYPDLCQLTNLNEQSLLENLKARFNRGHIYTYVGSILISVNPFKYYPIYNPKYVKLYQNHRLGDLPPHIFAIADAAYHCMLKQKKNQCIVISGESGSGKTEATLFLLHHLTMLSQKGSHGSGVEQTILSSGPVLEAFGNAKTAHNNNSSRFGKFIQVTYKENGFVQGACVQKYLLEKSRICSQAFNERSYHVFYYLLAGASNQERQALHLLKPSDYRYLNQSQCYTIEGCDEQYEFVRLKQSMEMVGFTPDKQNRLFAILSAVLLLGNIDFSPKKSTYHHDESVCVRNWDVACTIASLLGVAENTLVTALTSKKAKVQGEILVINYRLNEALAARSALAKCLYGALFDWIVLQVNYSLISLKDSVNDLNGNSIGVLDIFGFEDFGRQNRFEQLCINYANEHLQHYFNQHVFEYEQEEYFRENISWKNISFQDNVGCLALIEDKRNGLMCILDDQCNFPGATNETFLQKLNSVQKNNQYYEIPQKRESAFIVKHYAGKVKYQVEDMREKNLDLMRPELISVLKNSCYSIVRELAGADPVAVFRWAILRAFFRGVNAFKAGAKARRKSSGEHKRYSRQKVNYDNTRILAAIENTQNRLRKTRYNRSRYRGHGSRNQKNLKTVKALAQKTQTLTFQGRIALSRKMPLTVTGQFQLSLQALMEALNQSNPYFIRCIKSNGNKEANVFDNELVQRQLRYTGMLETVRIRQAGFNVRMTYDEFIQHYRILLPKGLLSSQVDVKSFLIQISLDRQEYQTGSSKIFMRESQKQKLDNQLHLTILSRIISIQRWYRTHHQRRKFLSIQNAVIRIQAQIRCWLAQQMLHHLKMQNEAAICIQRIWKGWRVRKWYVNLRTTIINLQARARGKLVRKYYRKLVESCLEDEEKRLEGSYPREVGFISKPRDSFSSETTVDTFLTREGSINSRSTIENKRDVRRSSEFYAGAPCKQFQVPSQRRSLDSRPGIDIYSDKFNQNLSQSSEFRGNKHLESFEFKESNIRSQQSPLIEVSTSQDYSKAVLPSEGKDLQKEKLSEFSSIGGVKVSVGDRKSNQSYVGDRKSNQAVVGDRKSDQAFVGDRKSNQAFVGEWKNDRKFSERHSEKLRLVEVCPDPRPMRHSEPEMKEKLSLEGLKIRHDPSSERIPNQKSAVLEKHEQIPAPRRKSGLQRLPTLERTPSDPVGSFLNQQSYSADARAAAGRRFSEATVESQRQKWLQSRKDTIAEMRLLRDGDTNKSKPKSNFRHRQYHKLPIEDNLESGASSLTDLQSLDDEKPPPTIKLSNIKRTFRSFIAKREGSVSESEDNSCESSGPQTPTSIDDPISGFVALGANKNQLHAKSTQSFDDGSVIVPQRRESRTKEYLQLAAKSIQSKSLDYGMGSRSLEADENMPMDTDIKKDLSLTHHMLKQSQIKKGETCSACDRHFTKFFINHGYKCTACKRLFHANCVKASKSVACSIDIPKKMDRLDESQWSLTRTSQFIDKSDDVIKDADELRNLEELLTKKMYVLEQDKKEGFKTNQLASLDSKDARNSQVDALFTLSLRRFKCFLVTTYSIALQKENPDVAIKYKDLIKNFEQVMVAVCQESSSDTAFPVNMGVNAFRGFLDEFLKEKHKEEDKTVTKKRKRYRKKKPKKTEEINFMKHKFVNIMVNIPMLCEVCNAFLWLSMKALSCKKCKLTCHQKCMNKIEARCAHDSAKAVVVSVEKNKNLVSRKKSVSLGKLFRIHLENLVQEHEKIPSIVENLLSYIEFNGIYTEGLYRKTGALAKAQELRNKIDSDPDSVDLGEYPIHVLATTFKSFLRELPEPLMTFDAYDPLLHASFLEDREDMFQATLNVVKTLPKANYDLLERLVFHLARVAQCECYNRMSCNSLAIVFTPCIMKCPREISVHENLSDISKQTQVLELLIERQLKKVYEVLRDIDNVDSASNTADAKLNSLRTAKATRTSQSNEERKQSLLKVDPRDALAMYNLEEEIQNLQKTRNILTLGLPDLVRASSEEDFLTGEMSNSYEDLSSRQSESNTSVSIRSNPSLVSLIDESDSSSGKLQYKNLDRRKARVGVIEDQSENQEDFSEDTVMV